MITGDAFNAGIFAKTGKTVQQNLLDIINSLTLRELYDDSMLTKAYVLFLVTEWVGCGRHDELSEGVQDMIEDLYRTPPQKFRDVEWAVRDICDRLDDVCAGIDGVPEGRIIQRFYVLKRAIELRRKAEPEVWEES